MSDLMLDELYMRLFATKNEAERLTMESGEHSDRMRQVALAKNRLLSELIKIRTEQLRREGPR